MNLSKKPETIRWPKMHYLYVERIGPFQENAPEAWQALHAVLPEILKNNEVTGFTSLYKTEPQMVYRSGVSVAAPPKSLPTGIQYMVFEGGKYSRWTLVGSYSQLPEACGMAWESLEELKIETRDDFAIENYKNNPQNTPEDELITEILIPTV